MYSYDRTASFSPAIDEASLAKVSDLVLHMGREVPAAITKIKAIRDPVQRWETLTALCGLLSRGGKECKAGFVEANKLRADADEEMRGAGSYPEDYSERPEKFASAIRLTPKELSRADSGYTVIVRPQADGGYLVAGVKINGHEGTLMGKPYTHYVDSQAEIPAAAKDVVRWFDKMGFPGDMGGASRDRL